MHNFHQQSESLPQISIDLNLDKIALKVHEELRTFTTQLITEPNSIRPPGAIEAPVNEIQRYGFPTPIIEYPINPSDRNADRHATSNDANDDVKQTKGDLGHLYEQTVNDPHRAARFQERLDAVQNFDTTTFNDIMEISRSMIEDKTLTPSEAGTEFGRILQSTVDRHPEERLDGEQMLLVQGAIAGLMLAEQANFNPEIKKELTIFMVVAAEQQLQNPCPTELHAIIFADGEPGVAVHPPATFNNLRYDGQEQ